MQLNHYNTEFNKQEFPITIVCHNITSPANVGSIFRAADAFGVHYIYFCESMPNLGARMQKTSRNAHNFIPFEMVDSTAAQLDLLTEKGYELVALEITSESIPLQEISLPKDKPIALVVGAENFGIPDTILAKTNIQTHIPMYGKNSSMNVAQALTLALYQITNCLANQ